jgi:hypothetical protein
MQFYEGYFPDGFVCRYDSWLTAGDSAEPEEK